MNKDLINKCKRVALLLTIGVGVGFATAGQAHADALSFGDNGGNQQISAQSNSNFSQEQKTLLHFQGKSIDRAATAYNQCLALAPDPSKCSRAGIDQEVKKLNTMEKEFKKSNERTNSRSNYDPAIGDM